MELKVYKDTVTTAHAICDTKLELPVETEILIPDYLPQVFKIVKCLLHPVVLQKQVLAGRLTVEGYLLCEVYYQAEGEQGLCQTQQKLPFTRQVELRAGEYSGALVTAAGETEYVNCRAVNQRRVDVRGAYVLRVSAAAQAREEFVTALAGGGIQQKTCALTGVRTLAVLEKLLTAEGPAAFEQPPAMVLRTDCTGEVREAKLQSGKVLVKGELRALVTYRAQPGGALLHTACTLPFSEVLDCDDAHEGCRCFALAEPAGCTITAADEAAGAATLSATAALTVRVYGEAECESVCDAFSVSEEVELEQKTLSLESAAQELTETAEVCAEGELPDESAQILDAWAEALPLEVLEQDGACALRVRAAVHLLCQNALGELDCYDKTGECTLQKTYPLRAGQLCVQYSAAAVQCAVQRAGAGRVQAAVTVRVRALVSELAARTVLADAHSTGPRAVPEGDIALRVCFACAGEDVFDIARRYASSPEDIAAANDIANGVLEADCRLLIPASL